MNSRRAPAYLARTPLFQIEPQKKSGLDDGLPMVQSATSSQLGMELSAALLRKAQSVQKVQGQAAIELIESASTNVDHSSSKGRRIDTLA